MFKKIVITLVFLVMFIYVPVLAEITIPNTSATSTLLAESGRGQIFLERNADKRMQIPLASKIMTAIIAIENLPEGTMITVSKEATLTSGAKLNLIAGERYLAENLIYALVLTDTNDAAIALAQSISDNLNDFVDIMNSYAATLDMNETVFKNPEGTTVLGQFTTAKDLMNLTRYALNNERFNTIFGTQIKPMYDEKSTNIIINQNSLFKTYRGIDGGKNSSDNSNNYSSITTSTRDDLRLISIVLNSPENKVLEDTVLSLDYGFTNYQKGLLVKKDEILKTIKIQDQLVNLIPKKDVYYTFLKNSNYIQDIKEIYNTEANKLPIDTNTTLLTMEYTLMDGTIINVDLYSNREISKPLSKIDIIKKQLKENKEISFLILLLVGIELLILFVKLLKILFSTRPKQKI